nr:MAG TPA: hypothetical protein [Caudoviricetes sp.]
MFFFIFWHICKSRNLITILIFLFHCFRLFRFLFS